MKKIILLFIYLYVFSFFYPVCASDAAVDNSNWGVSPTTSQNKQGSGEQEEKVLDNEQNQTIYENYGSKESPAFLNSVNSPEDEGEYDSGAGEYNYNDPYDNE